MDFTLTILPGGRKIQARRGTTLLEALIGGSVFLRSDCGGTGKCGKCQVEIVDLHGGSRLVEACTSTVTQDLSLRIPQSSLLTSHIIDKAPVSPPAAFLAAAGQAPEEAAGKPLGLAVDLGTTTIAVYLCDLVSRRVIASLATKNPQAIYGDDVMSRIGAIGGSGDKLTELQRLTTGAIAWGSRELLHHAGKQADELARLTVVGNPAMIHIFLGVDPGSIGIAPYHPAFCEQRLTDAEQLGLELPGTTVATLPQLSGFLGGDILSASLAAEITEQPQGTLLIDLGTNGELLLKGKDGYYATSCATGPAFEGAAISCGMQAVAGAIDKIRLPDPQAMPLLSVIRKKAGSTTRPLGICGSGIISGIAAMLHHGLVRPDGLLVTPGKDGGRRYVVVAGDSTADGREIAISQKDIRSVQLGKAALITGIEFLLQAAGLSQPEKIIVAGAFGAYLDPLDMIRLGLVPPIADGRIHFAGNLAGTGAIMALCEPSLIKRAAELATRIQVLELATNADFQRVFVERLAFPQLQAR